MTALTVLKVVLIVILALYFVFIFAPSIVCFILLFKRKTGVSYMDRDDLESTYLCPFIEQIKDGFAFMESLKSEPWEIESYDGLKLKGDYYDCGSDKTAILVHGYASTSLNNFCILGADLYRDGYNLLLIHQRAHDVSEGKHFTFGAREKFDILDWVDVVSSDEKIKTIVLGGVSTGAATVALCSPKIESPKVKTLIIDCGFMDAYHQLADGCRNRSIPWKLMMPVLRLWAIIFLKADIKKESAFEALKSNKIPAVFIHGTDDDTVDFKHGVANYEACAAPKEKIFPVGGNHSSSYLFGGKDAKDKLFAFLNRYVG